MRCFIDTNIFLRVLVRENQQQFDECSGFLEKIVSRKISAVTSDIVLSEIAWTLKTFYKQPKDKIVKCLSGVDGFNLAYNNNFQTKLAISMFLNKNVKYIDCLIASIPQIQDKKWTVVSYDKDFDKLRVIRKEPKDLV